MSNVPKLRFKEFGGKWEENKLSEVANIIGGGTPETAIEEYWNGDIQWFTPTEIKSDYVSNSLRSISELGLKKSSAKILPKGTILLTTRATIGEVSIALRECTTNQGFQSLIVKDDYINIFIFNWIKNNKYKFTSKANGSTFPEISKSEIEKIRIKIPSKPEQEKIASFLTSVDTRIEQLTKKEALLQEYKKGVMSKIFNQDIRFKDDDGSEFPEWEENTLENFLNLTLREVQKPNENYLAIGIRSHCKGTFQKPDSEPHKIAMDKLYQVKENDLIVNITFAWESAIAIVKKEDENGLVSHRFPTYTFNKNLAIVEFFRYVIIQKKFRLMLDLISPGGAGRNRVMSKKDFLKLKWELPCIQEQTKIANFLSSIDKKIELTIKELNSTKEFKKALLQQMFI